MSGKRCCTCHEVKPLEAFNCKAKARDGRQPRCRDCRLAAYAADPEKFRAQGLKWVREHAERVREKRRIRNRTYRLPPDRLRVRWTVQNAIRRGKLKPQPCESCGAKPVDAHHDDYSKPMDVRWLCKPCHGRHHRKHQGTAS